LQICNKHTLDLLGHRAVWAPHVVNGAVCGCNRNTAVPWLVSRFANAFPLVHNDHIVPGIVNWDFLFTSPLLMSLVQQDMRKSTVTGQGSGAASKTMKCMWTPVPPRRRRWQHGILHVLWPSDSLLMLMPVSGHATTMWVVLMSSLWGTKWHNLLPITYH
jgi:hypothetical protein